MTNLIISRPERDFTLRDFPCPLGAIGHSVKELDCKVQNDALLLWYTHFAMEPDGFDFYSSKSEVIVIIGQEGVLWANHYHLFQTHRTNSIDLFLWLEKLIRKEGIENEKLAFNAKANFSNKIHKKLLLVFTSPQSNMPPIRDRECASKE